MSHVANLVLVFGMVIGFPIGYYFCKFKYRREIESAEVK